MIPEDNVAVGIVEIVFGGVSVGISETFGKSVRGRDIFVDSLNDMVCHLTRLIRAYDSVFEVIPQFVVVCDGDGISPARFVRAAVEDKKVAGVLIPVLNKVIEVIGGFIASAFKVGAYYIHYDVFLIGSRHRGYGC